MCFKKFVNVKVFHFSGARIEDLNHYIVPIIKNKPDYLILHVGTNDATTNSSRKTVDDLLMLRTNISKQLQDCRIVALKPTTRHDYGKANLTVRNINKHLENWKLEWIDNSNINAEHVGDKGLHLNHKGKGRLGLNFLKQFGKVWRSVEHVNENLMCSNTKNEIDYNTSGKSENRKYTKNTQKQFVNPCNRNL